MTDCEGAFGGYELDIGGAQAAMSMRRRYAGRPRGSPPPG